ncbi:MAG: peptidase S8 [Flavobacterium sp.]|nr:MAG: peptidase S8 [Flavobacterium sp.]
MNKFLAAALIIPFCGFAQETSTAKFPDLNWYNADNKADNLFGTSVDKAYKELLIGKQPKKTVIVAVIDSGVDINHEDLKDKIWVNDDEIAGNNIDDDHNGFIDDVHGWNFLGNSKGENINYENYEYVRVYESGPKNKDYESAKKQYEAELDRRTKDRKLYADFEEQLNLAKSIIKDKTGISVSRPEDLKAISSTDDRVLAATAFLQRRFDAGFDEESFKNSKQRNADFFERYLNLDFNPRKIAGDNPEDINDVHYGNPDVFGPRANHGTGVSGIIAGVRGNGIGIDGIAANVKIMVLRTTPDGDERDKDVALAIRYAVANGARIINMSFGKSLSPQKQFVDDAIRFAEKNNVLVIHAAGNDGVNLDTVESFPSDLYLDGKRATNFLNVGASDKHNGTSVAAEFSNYSKTRVDIFAPGVDIVASDVNNTYSMNSGTSDAAPVVTGIAALTLSYYPELKPQELIAILLDSAADLKDAKVEQPNRQTREKTTVPFGSLCKSGGIVNAYSALKLAEKRASAKH